MGIKLGVATNDTHASALNHMAHIGVIEHFYKEDAESDPDQVRAIEQAVVTLQKLGAQVKTIRLSPLNELV